MSELSLTSEEKQIFVANRERLQQKRKEKRQLTLKPKQEKTQPAAIEEGVLLKRAKNKEAQRRFRERKKAAIDRGETLIRLSALQKVILITLHFVDLKHFPFCLRRQ